jgi:hypothetical protein
MCVGVKLEQEKLEVKKAGTSTQSELKTYGHLQVAHITPVFDALPKEGKCNVPRRTENAYAADVDSISI